MAYIARSDKLHCPLVIVYYKIIRGTDSYPEYGILDR